MKSPYQFDIASSRKDNMERSNELSTRAANVLRVALTELGVYRHEHLDLRHYADAISELMRVGLIRLPNAGKTTIAEIERWFATSGWTHDMLMQKHNLGRSLDQAEALLRRHGYKVVSPRRKTDQLNAGWMNTPT